MDCNTIQIFVNSRRTIALLDTGAFKSCISGKMADKLGLVPDKSKLTLSALQSAGGECLTITGIVQLSIKINGLVIPFDFQVIPTLSVNLILGIDFLTTTKAKIDLSTSTVTFYDDLVMSPLTTKVKNNPSIVTLSESIVIPPQCEAIIPVDIAACYALQPSIIEPITHFKCRRVILAKCAVEPREHRTMCRVLNANNSAVVLKKGSPVAKISPILQNEQSQQHQQHSDTVTHAKSADEKLKWPDSAINRKNLTKEQQDILAKFLNKNTDLIANDIADLPGTDLIQHRIETGDAPPQRQRAYRHPPHIKHEIERQTAELLKHGIISESDSLWNAPIILVKKKDQQMRFVTDFRKLNSVTKPIFFPIPTLDDVVDCMSENKPSLFTVLDLRHAYFQIKLDPETSYKSGFVTHQGVFQYNRLAFGLTNAPATWQHLISTVLRRILWKNALAYLDDIIIWSNNFEEHLQHLEYVFQCLRAAKLRLNPSKCEFLLTKVTYLGHVITPDGIAVDTKKIEAMLSYPVPKTQKQLRQALGLFNYYRKFVLRYSQRVGCLTHLLKKGVPFEWTPECDAAFADLKMAMTTTPVLAFADMSREFILTCDASQTSIAYILGQIGLDGKEHVVSYGGRNLRSNEKNFGITELECLALLEGVKQYHVYLANRPFVVYTDHLSLKYLKTLKNSTGRLFRWALALQPYSFEVKFKSGITNGNADALSRRHYQTSECGDNDNSPLTNVLESGNVDRPTFNVFDALKPTLDYDEMADCNTLSQPTSKPMVDSDSLAQNWTRNAEIFSLALAQQNRSDLTAIQLEFHPADCCHHAIAAINNQSVVTPAEPIALTKGSLPTLQRQCPDFQPYFSYLEMGELPSDDTTARKIIMESENFVIIDKTLYHLFHPRRKNLEQIKPVISQICVPRVLREQILLSYHDQNAHIGIEKLFESVKQKYYWRNLYIDCRDYTLSCQECQRSKTSTRAKRAPLKSIETTSKIFSRFHLDILGPLPETADGFKYILVGIEALSRYPIAIPMKTQEAEEVAQIIYRDLISTFGAPTTLLTDRGSNFTSKLVTALCKLFHISRALTSSYHPQTNSVSELFNKNLLQTFRLYCTNQSDWIHYIPSVLMAYRSAPVKSTGMSPFFVLYGQEMSLPIDTSIINELNVTGNAEDYIRRLLPDLQIARDIASQNITESQAASKLYYDRNTAFPNYHCGDKVMLFDFSNKKGVSPKIKRRWLGPYFIVQVGENFTYKLVNCQDMRPVKAMVHANRLKPFRESRDAMHTRNLPPKPSTPHVPADQNHDQVDPSTSMPSKSNTADHIVKPNELHEIDRILRSKRQGKSTQYLIKWQDGATSWEPASNVPEFVKSQFIIEQMNRKNALRRSPRQIHRKESKNYYYY